MQPSKGKQSILLPKPAPTNLQPGSLEGCEGTKPLPSFLILAIHLTSIGQNKLYHVNLCKDPLNPLPMT